MSLRYRDVMFMDEACAKWLSDYDHDSYYTDPTEALMDGTQDGRVILLAARLLVSVEQFDVREAADLPPT